MKYNSFVFKRERGDTSMWRGKYSLFIELALNSILLRSVRCLSGKRCHFSPVVLGLPRVCTRVEAGLEVYSSSMGDDGNKYSRTKHTQAILLVP